MHITEFLTLSIIIGLIAYSLLATLIVNGWQRCQFCTGFWISFLLTGGYYILHGFTPELIALPFAAAAVCHFINK